MINGRKNKEVLTEEQQRIRNKELIGLPLTRTEKRLIEGRIPIMSGVVPMKNTTKYHDRITTPPSSIKEPDEIDLDEVLREMGYNMEEGGVDDEVEVDEELDIKGLTIQELEDLIYKVLTDRENQ